MKRIILLLCLLLIGGLLFASHNAAGFGEVAGSCETDCQKCHKLSKDDASGILKELNPAIEVLEVRQSPVRGLWEVTFKMQGRAGLVYVDFSKEKVIQGQILNVKIKKDLTTERLQELNKVDVSKIPLNEALVMGKKDAKYKVVVFTDPD
ncbi:MAG: disulfide isomerase DsbC N-terminal domain-containing protein [Parvibaculum sp.]|uniref:disulfide isomerase DsbC N-terminal domain-containing protein n=1 Tax=Parvibaculum sp. TaxID=2024848 RepID=UPI00272FA3E7|nr:disulfide isomerase DsbC N-terminal domain-containing protein [Parvibaculum sp.]MDP2151609.1 disulfide isomerase DsbC N-terminal domain-containing protein [Parvibaculum sp.]